jgi:tRNA(Ile)-lysidine synthase
MSVCDQRFRDFLATHADGTGADPRLVVGFSGGLDSTVLLHLAHRHAGQRTRAIHVNHGYSPAAGDWEAHCQRYCDALGVAFTALRLPTLSAGKPFSEGEARTQRYQQFSKSLGQDDVLLLAHHRDDRAETLLLHLFQGRGSFSMPAVRPFGSGQLWRPLLALAREDLRRYATSHELQWLDDPSNEDRRHDRNFLRHEVMPRLNERFQSLPERLAQAATQHQTMERLLTQLLDLQQATLPLETLAARPLAEQATIIRLWLRSHHYPQPSSASLNGFLAQLASAADDRQPELRWENRQLRRFAGQLWCIRIINPAFASLQISGPGEWRLPQGRLRISGRPEQAFASDDLTVHFWQAPDLACPQHIRQGGHARSIKEALRVAGVPPWRRPGYPVVADRHGVVCVPGVASREDDDAGGEAGISIDWQPDD